MRQIDYPEVSDFNQPELLIPSADFKIKSRKAILAILGFFLMYLLFVISGILLMVGTVYLSLKLFTFSPGFLTLMIGVGLCLISFSLGMFSLKAIFARSVEEKVNRIEITRKEQPELFDFIDKVGKETGTKPPHKIFLSPGVNAMVFYKSGFLSFFFPVRKNLDLGLGLINTVTVTELKSVIGHELGHFSQKSLRLGTYLYTINRVIFNLIYGYDSWDKWLAQWSSEGGPKGVFAYNIIMITDKIKKLMGKAYDFVMLRYLDLSREMEFHADLIAASISGVENYKTALRKIEFSGFAFEYGLMILNNLLSEGKKTADLFDNHLDSVAFLAEQNKIKYSNQILEITDHDIERSVIKTRVNIHNQWASHPLLAQRENNINRIRASVVSSNTSAWNLLNNAQELKRQLTQMMYLDAPDQQNAEIIPREDFEIYMKTQANRFKISERYHDYFENRYLRVEAWENIESLNSDLKFEDIFSREKSEFIKKAKINKLDSIVVNQIKEQKIPVKYFEFDEKKYSYKNCQSVITELEIVADSAELEITNMDKQALGYFFKKAQNIGRLEDLKINFESLIQFQQSLKKADNLLESIGNFHFKLGTKPQWTPEEVVSLHEELMQLEVRAKSIISENDKSALLEQITHKPDISFFSKGMEDEFRYSESPFSHESIFNVTKMIQFAHFSLNNLFGLATKKFTDFGLEISGHQS